MRDINRLNDLYEEIKKYHKELYDLRFIQLMYSFLNWHHNKYKNDGFYLEDDKFIIEFKEFVSNLKEDKYNANVL